LSESELVELKTLAMKLNAESVASRERAARAIRTRFGARAAGPLLELAERDLDCERRFRERSLVHSLVFDHFLDQAPNCGWLGIRWIGSSTEKHYFCAHVVEAVLGDPAQRAGLRANDEIVAWNGRAIENQMDFIDHVQSQAPGSVATLTLERAGHETIIKVTMGTRTSDVTHLPELPYPTFQRDMANRQVIRWLDEWQKHR
jgi:predicted metalloprotease with PDZ domain